MITNKHYARLKELQDCTDESEEAERIVVDAVHKEFNIEYPMLKEISFRESIEYSYTISDVYQIFILRTEKEESKFISNDAMKKLCAQNKGEEQNVTRQYHCYRMMHFYSSKHAKEY